MPPQSFDLSGIPDASGPTKPPSGGAFNLEGIPDATDATAPAKSSVADRVALAKQRIKGPGKYQEPLYRGAIGAAKQIGETATGLVEMIPGGQTALDAIYKHVYGIQNPEAARAEGLKREGTAEKVGAFGATAAELAVPERAAAGVVSKIPTAMRTARRVVKTGLTAAGTYGVAKAQGDENPATVAAIGAAGPAVEGFVPAGVRWLRSSAKEKLAQFFGNTPLEPKHVRDAATLIVPTALDEGIPSSWKTWAAKTEAAKGAKGRAVEMTVAGPAGDMWAPVQPVIDALEALKQKAAVVMMPVGTQGQASVPTAVMTKNDQLLRAINTFQKKLQMLPTNNGDVPARILHDIKSAWNDLVYMKRATTDLNVRDLALNAKKRAAKTAVGAIRDVLDTASPQIAQVDTAYHIATQLHQAVLDAALEATGKVEQQVASGVSGAVRRSLGTAAGATYGAFQGGTYGYQHGGVGTAVKDAAVGAVVGGLTGRYLQQAFQSPAWKVAGPKFKSELAAAIVSGKADAVRKLVTPLITGAAAGTPTEKSKEPTPTPGVPQAHNRHLGNALEALQHAERIGPDKFQQALSDAAANPTRAEMPIGPEGIKFLGSATTKVMEKMAEKAAPTFQKMVAEGAFRGERNVIGADEMRALAFLPKALPALTGVAKTILAKTGNLGFDTIGQAMTAIRSHPDWATRWNVVGRDAEVLERWRAAHLLAHPPEQSVWSMLKKVITDQVTKGKAAKAAETQADAIARREGMRLMRDTSDTRKAELLQKFGGRGTQ